MCHNFAACQLHTPSSLAAVIGLSNDDVISLRCVRCVGWKLCFTVHISNFKSSLCSKTNEMLYTRYMHFQGLFICFCGHSSVADPPGGAYSVPPDPLFGGEGARFDFRPFGLGFTGLSSNFWLHLWPTSVIIVN